MAKLKSPISAHPLLPVLETPKLGLQPAVMNYCRVKNWGPPLAAAPSLVSSFPWQIASALNVRRCDAEQTPKACPY